MEIGAILMTQIQELHMITALSLMVVAYAYSHFTMMKSGAVPELKGEMKMPEPIMYAMHNEDGSVIIEEIDVSDFDSINTKVKTLSRKVSDIVEGQYWVEAMQMLDIITATRVIGLSQPT